MKYGLFLYSSYYAYGGFNDFHKAFDTLENLKIYIRSIVSNVDLESLQIVDFSELKIVATFNYDDLYNYSRQKYGEHVEVKPIDPKYTVFRGIQVGPDHNTYEIRTLKVSAKDFLLEKLEELQ